MLLRFWESIYMGSKILTDEEGNQYRIVNPNFAKEILYIEPIPKPPEKSEMRKWIEELFPDFRSYQCVANLAFEKFLEVAKQKQASYANGNAVLIKDLEKWMRVKK